MAEAMPNPTTTNCPTTAVLTPATDTSAPREPWAKALATISATVGPGIKINTAVAATKVR